jgi:hypothetical protein
MMDQEKCLQTLKKNLMLNKKGPHKEGL